MKQEKIDAIYNYMKKERIVVTKDRIYKDLELTRWAVNEGCRILRKEGKIGLHYGRWWGVR